MVFKHILKTIFVGVLFLWGGIFLNSEDTSLPNEEKVKIATNTASSEIENLLNPGSENFARKNRNEETEGSTSDPYREKAKLTILTTSDSDDLPPDEDFREYYEKTSLYDPTKKFVGEFGDSYINTWILDRVTAEETEDGLLLLDIPHDSDLFNLSLRDGDVLKSVNGYIVKSLRDLTILMDIIYRSSDEIEITYNRAKVERTIEIKK